MPSILLVEDNPAHAELIRRVLNRHAPELEVRVLTDGEEALGFLLHQERSEQTAMPDLVLLDIRLPRLDGHAVLRQMKQHERTRKIPVIMLTTSSTQEDVVSALDREAVDYLVKPLNEAHVRAIRRALEADA